MIQAATRRVIPTSTYQYKYSGVHLGYFQSYLSNAPDKLDTLKWFVPAYYDFIIF